MHDDLLSDDVLQDPVVGRGRASDVVFGLEAIDRHDHGEARDGGPGGRNRTDGTRHDLDVQSPIRQARQDDIQFPEAHQRLAANERHVDGPMTVHERQNAVDEGLSLEVSDLPKRHAAPQMLVAIGVATWAAQRALPGDFDRERR